MVHVTLKKVFQAVPIVDFQKIMGKHDENHRVLYPSYDVSLPVVYKKPGSSSPASKVDLEILGQGTVSYMVKPKRDADLYYTVNFIREDGTKVLKLRIMKDCVELSGRDQINFVVSKVKQFHFNLVDFKAQARYLWVSVDKHNSVIKMGAGYMMEVNTLYKFTFVKGREEAVDTTIRSIKQVQLEDGKLAGHTKYWVLPVVSDPPAKVVPMDEMTLDHISNNTAMPYLALPSEAQRLYGHVAGLNIKLSKSDVAAINYSLDTEGCALNTKLMQKTATLFGHDKLRSYIRATIGWNKGDSTGTPYVLEIWPKLHYSPIHSHGDTVAIIKVLHGSLVVSGYNPLMQESDEPPQKINECLCSEGDITWMTPELYQTHKLFNFSTTSMTATIQCYGYLGSNMEHHETFDYVLENDCKLHYFMPKADFTYDELLRIVRQEYADYKASSTKNHLNLISRIGIRNLK